MISNNKFPKPDKVKRIVDFRESGKEMNKQAVGSTRVGQVYEAQHIGGDDMDDLLKSYIEKVDRDQSELKIDMREREERIEKRISESESRMDARLDRIENMLNDQNNKIDDLKEHVNEKLEDDKKYRHTNNIAIVLGVIATVIAMVGIYYATVSTITDIISM